MDMCRMLGVLAVKRIDPLKYLVEAECSLLKQAELGDQGDGWGIAYYLDGSPKLYRSEKPVFLEKDRFKSIASSISSNILIAHVRKASNPRNLPRDALISIENSQPFLYEKWIFAHNGVIYMPDELAEELGEYSSIVSGVNDSEVYFAYLIKKLYSGISLPNALKELEEDMWRIMRRSRKDLRRPYSSLNAIISDGERIYAFNKWVNDVDQRSLCYRDKPYYMMTYKHGKDEIIVASERLFKNGGWRDMEDGELLIAWREGEEIAYTIEKLI